MVGNFEKITSAGIYYIVVYAGGWPFHSELNKLGWVNHQRSAPPTRKWDLKKFEFRTETALISLNEKIFLL